MMGFYQINKLSLLFNHAYFWVDISFTPAFLLVQHEEDIKAIIAVHQNMNVLKKSTP